MHSSIFNFSYSKNFWFHLVACTLILLFAWEITLRGLGFRPSVRDTDILWSKERVKVISRQAALVGASRFTAAMYPENLTQIFDGKVPVQLAKDGSQALYPFFNLADDSEFNGIVMVSVVPGSFYQSLAAWAKPGWTARFECMKKCSVLSRIENTLRIPLQEKFSFYAPENSLSVLLQHLLDKKTVLPGFELDPPWGQRDLFQRDRTKKAADVKALWKESDLNQLREFWPFIVENWDAPSRLQGNDLDNHLESIQVAINKIHNRGGQVIFISLPSEGKLREAEGKFFPRAEYWDKLASLDNALFINSYDFPEFSKFKTTDDSHFSPSDAPRFSKKLTEIIIELKKDPAEM